jgi:hypothetical protein
VEQKEKKTADGSALQSQAEETSKEARRTAETPPRGEERGRARRIGSVGGPVGKDSVVRAPWSHP